MGDFQQGVPVKMIFALLALSAPAFAAPGVITVVGKLSPPNGDHCRASTYGYILSGNYTDATGATEQVGGCVVSIAMPLDVSECIAPKKGNDNFKKATQALKATKNLKNAAKFTLAVDDMSNPDMGTILSIESDCK